MRRTTIQFIFIFCCIQAFSQGLTNHWSPGGVMDTVFDRFGKKHALNELVVNGGNGNTYNVTSINSCTAGMFVVYFGLGSGMELTNNSVHASRRQTVCEVLSNLSGLLGYNTSYPNSALVRILVDDVSPYVAPLNPSSSGVLGLATSFYAVPFNPASNHPGIVENMIQRTIRTKTDAWTNVVSPVMPINGNSLYHGVMAFNFSNPGITWNSNISSLASASQYDLYTVILHEITHALGFASLVGSNGISRFGALNNYYSTYDQFLYYKNANNTLVPLLSAGNACQPQYGLSFSGNTLVLAPGCNGSYQPDVTNCQTAIQYSSVNCPNMPVYTPACFEPGSSLSHFEDMCYPSNNPSNNNLYFTMCNAQAPGTNKRYLKQEERNVLCDLGYYTGVTYTSNAIGASTTYTGGSCSGWTIWGKNDGVNSAGFVYVSTGSPVSIPINGAGGIIANDYQGSAPITTIACVESVYNNGTAMVSGTNIIFTPIGTNGGIFVIRYIPQTANGDIANITYIFGFTYPSYCGSITPCDMVQNGGFETYTGCGSMPIGSNTMAACWLVSSLTPDIFARGCSSSSMTADLGSNTYSSNVVFDSYNGSPNNVVVGFGAANPKKSELSLSESLANFLGSSVQYNQVYTLSFWAYQFYGMKYDPDYSYTQAQLFNQDSVNAVISFATHSVFIPSPSSNANTYPYYPLSVIQSVTLGGVFNQWRHYSITFTNTATNNGNWLYVGTDRVLTSTNLLNHDTSYQRKEYLFYTLLDDISLKPAHIAPQLTLPSQICYGESIIDLDKYVNVQGGSFTGAGITTVAVISNSAQITQYNFNAALMLKTGLYTITFTYTDNIGCTQSTVHQITIGKFNNNMKLAYYPAANCINAGTLTVLSPTVTGNYTWQPGSFIGTQYTISPNLLTTYTVSSGNPTSYCSLQNTIQVVPNIPYVKFIYNNNLCGDTAIISAAGNYTSIIWSPGNYTSGSIVVPPNAILNYTISVSSAAGCSMNTVVPVHSGVKPIVTIAASSKNICLGQSISLTASGAQFYYWNTGASNSMIVVSPTQNAVFSVTGTDLNGCDSTVKVGISVINPSISINHSDSICSGEQATLTAQSGANVYSWWPIGVYSPTAIVKPLVSTTYTLHCTFNSLNSSCSVIKPVTINVDPCTGIVSTLMPRTFNVFPNPNPGSFTIEHDPNPGSAVIFNESGQMVENLHLSDEESTTVTTDLPPGFYIVRIGHRTAKLVIIH